jgi:hypothetical protein
MIKRPGVKNGPRRFEMINGKLYKTCNGPLHHGELVSADQFRKRNPDKDTSMYRAQCRACETTKDGFEPYVDLTLIWRNWIEEIVNRVGVFEGCRRMGMSASWYRWMKRNKPRHLRRSTARKVIHTLRELRRNEVVRHKDSIRNGSYLRGFQEKKPVRERDLYRRRSDAETETTRKRRSRT